MPSPYPLTFAAFNVNRRCLLAKSVTMAGSSSERRRGLLGKTALTDDEGLLIAPCEAIHTFGMKLRIDVAFLDRNHRVRHVYPAVPANRMRIDWAAASALELPAGTLQRTCTVPGDSLTFDPVPCP